MADGDDFNGKVIEEFRAKERMPNFAEYEKSAAPREIPVILLDPEA